MQSRDHYFGARRLALYGVVAALIVGGTPLIFGAHEFAVGTALVSAAVVLLLATVGSGYLAAKHERRAAPATAAVAVFTAPPNAELAVTLLREEFHPFHYRAVILAIKMRVENLTDKVKYLGPIQLTTEGGGFPMAVDAELIQFRVALEHGRPQIGGIIQPSDAVEGWLVVPLPRQPRGVVQFSITVEDEIGGSYELRRERRGERYDPDLHSSP